MPRYHFHFANGQACPDLHGTELADDEAAQVAAVQFLGELLLDRRSSFWESRALEIEVLDPAGTSMFLLQVNASVSVPLSRSPRGT